MNNYYPYWQRSVGTGGNNIHLAQVPAITGDFRMAAVPGDVACTLLSAVTGPVTIAVCRPCSLPVAG